eukprot:tig00021348_g20526.t1
MLADGDVAGVEKYLTMGINVNVADWDERRVIHMAANYGHEEMLRMLLARGADKNIADKWGITPLHEACMNDHADIALVLIEAGADLGAKNNEKKTPMELASPALRRELIERSLRHVSWELFHAAKNGNLETVRHLVESGRVDINVQDWDARAPIHLAAEYGHAEMLDWMLANGGDKNIQDRWGVTPSHEAAKHEHFEIAVSLLEAGADMNVVDEAGRRALELASPELRRLLDEKLDLWNSAMRGDLETVRNILAGNAIGVHSVDADGSTALFSACAGGHMHVLKYLLIMGADRNHQNKRGETPLMYALVHKRDTVTRYLVDNGAALALKTTRGHTALYFALKSRRRRMVRLLIQKGAAFSFGEPYWSLVKDAVKRSEAEFFACLEENGIGLTAEVLVEVMLAAGRYGSEPVLSMCLKKGASVNAAGSGGRRLIHQLAQHGHFRLMKVLLRDYRPEVNARDADNATPLLLAARGSHVNTSYLLLKAGATGRFEAPQFTKLLSDAVQQNHLLCACALVERGVAMSPDVLDIAERHVREKGLPAEGEGEEGEARAVLQFYASVLWHAALEGRSGCLRILAANGVDVNFRSPVSAGVGLGTGNTPLMIAAARGHAEIVEALLAAPALHAVNLPNDAGNTALKLACEGGHTRVAALLLERAGAAVDARDSQGRTALGAAVARAHLDLVRLLVARRLRGGPVASSAGPAGPPGAGEDEREREGHGAGALPPQLEAAGARPDAKLFVDALVGTEAVALVRRKYAVRQVWRESLVYAATVLLLTVLAFHAYGGSHNRAQQYEVGWGLRRGVVETGVEGGGRVRPLPETLLRPALDDGPFAPRRSFSAFWRHLSGRRAPPRPPAHLGPSGWTMEDRARSLVPSLVAGDGREGLLVGGYLLSGRDLLLGPLRIRQVRSRGDACAVPAGFEAAVPRCFAADPAAEETRPFAAPAGNFSSPAAAGAFEWRSARALSSSDLSGVAGTYSGGGYAIDISPLDWPAGRGALEEMQARRWIDAATRALLLQFNALNPSEGVAAAVHVLYEFPPSGGIVPQYFVAVGRLPRFVHNSAAGIAVLLLEIAVVGLHGYYIVAEARAVVRHGRGHLLSAGFLYNAALYSLFVAMVSLRLDAAASLAAAPAPTAPGPYVDLLSPLGRQQSARELLGVVLILSWMRVLKIMRILPVSGPILQSVFNTFVNPSVLTILLLFALVLGAFSLGLHVVLHDSHADYRSFGTALSRAFTVTFGDVGGGQREVSPYPIAAALYAAFLLAMCFLVVNLFISVFIEEYRAARESQQARYNDHITALMEGEPAIEEAARREAAFQRLVEARYAAHVQKQASIRAGTTFRGRRRRGGRTPSPPAPPPGRHGPRAALQRPRLVRGPGLRAGGLAGWRAEAGRARTGPVVVATRHGPLEIPRLPVHLIPARLAQLAAQPRDVPLTPPAAHGRAGPRGGAGERGPAGPSLHGPPDAGASRHGRSKVAVVRPRPPRPAPPAPARSERGRGGPGRQVLLDGLARAARRGPLGRALARAAAALLAPLRRGGAGGRGRTRRRGTGACTPSTGAPSFSLPTPTTGAAPAPPPPRPPPRRDRPNSGSTERRQVELADADAAGADAAGRRAGVAGALRRLLGLPRRRGEGADGSTSSDRTDPDGSVRHGARSPLMARLRLPAGADSPPRAGRGRGDGSGRGAGALALARAGSGRRPTSPGPSPSPAPRGLRIRRRAAFAPEAPDALFFREGGPAWSYLQRARLVKPGALPPGEDGGSSGHGGAARGAGGAEGEEGYGAEGGLRDPASEAHRQRLQALERELVAVKMALEKGLLTQSEQVQKMRRNLEALTFLSEDSLLNAEDRLGAMTAVRTRELSRLQTALGDVSASVARRTRVAAAAAKKAA